MLSKLLWSQYSEFEAPVLDAHTPIPLRLPNGRVKTMHSTRKRELLIGVISSSDTIAGARHAAPCCRAD